VIRAGGVQWMTAGRGLVHAEISPDSFKQHGGPLEILQLWVNLPSRLKMVDPHYVGLQKADIPELREDDGRVTVNLISGAWNGQPAPIQSLIDVHMATLYFQPGGRVEVPVARDRNVFLYIVRGTVAVGGDDALPFHLIELENDADAVTIEASADAVVLFGHALPIGEPMIAHGPFVMNTRDEIRQAMLDYQSGKFGGLGKN
jgi:redox-sensitive bicupin YhaK (pirin superfamily)